MNKKSTTVQLNHVSGLEGVWLTTMRSRRQQRQDIILVVADTTTINASSSAPVSTRLSMLSDLCLSYYQQLHQSLPTCNYPYCQIRKMIITKHDYLRACSR